jgi:hypothetical protein
VTNATHEGNPRPLAMGLQLRLLLEVMDQPVTKIWNLHVHDGDLLAIVLFSSKETLLKENYHDSQGKMCLLDTDTVR